MDYNNTIKVPRFNEEAGFYTTNTRSKLMSKIGGKNTKPEIKFRRALWSHGYRYRKNYKDLIGKPDIVFRQFKIVVFIDGEFWHGYNWNEKKEKIKSNRGFWIPKIERNMQRDAEVNAKLIADGYKVFRFWEKEIQNNFDSCLNQVIDYIEKFKFSHLKE